jgi:low affinity Fe/Cu permease
VEVFIRHQQAAVGAFCQQGGAVMVRYFAPMLTRMGVLTAHPAAFGVVLCYVVAWLIFSLQTFDWHAVAMIATWIMTLFIQRAEHRDTQAIHAT